MSYLMSQEKKSLKFQTKYDRSVEDHSPTKKYIKERKT